MPIALAAAGEPSPGGQQVADLEQLADPAMEDGDQDRLRASASSSRSSSSSASSRLALADGVGEGPDRARHRLGDQGADILRP